jgi:hypothetical protein
MESRAAATQENLGNVSCPLGVPRMKMKYLTLREHGWSQKTWSSEMTKVLLIIVKTARVFIYLRAVAGHLGHP